MQDKRNKIPVISNDRLDNSNPVVSKPGSAVEYRINNLLKGKEPTQTFTARIPKDLYLIFRRLAFEENIKMNQIIVDLIDSYVKKHKKTINS